MDFMTDSLVDGHKFRLLTIVDNFSCVSPAVEVDFSLTGQRVVEVLEHLGNCYGLPKSIRVDNGTEFASKAVDEWAYRKGIKLEFSRPGKPMDNGYIESFNGKLRAECLNQNWFESIEEARSKIEQWRVGYNEYRPRSALGQQTPRAECLRNITLYFQSKSAPQVLGKLFIRLAISAKLRTTTLQLRLYFPSSIFSISNSSFLAIPSFALNKIFPLLI